MTKPDLDSFFAQAPTAVPVSTMGNTPWASAAARRFMDILQRYSARRPRSLQRHLGPSELGVQCDRQVVGKLIGEPSTNHVTDPWPSWMGTAGHAEADVMMQWENTQLGGIRYLPERKVHPAGPFVSHPGTADLYDAWEYCVLDHKFQGSSSQDKLKNVTKGPPRKYVAQLGLYGLGYMREGLRVDRVALISWPRTSSNLHDLYVWEHPMDGEMAALLTEVADDTARRKWQAQEVLAGKVALAFSLII